MVCVATGGVAAEKSAVMSHTYHRYKIGDEPVAGYHLTDHLGAGGFGEVWKANAPGGTEVALKIIDLTGQQGLQEFTSLRVVKKVRHPNLMSLQAFWMKDEEGKIIDEAGESSKAAVSVTAAIPDPKRQTQSVGIAVTANFARPVELIIAMQLGSMSLHKRLEDCREQGQPGVPVAELLEYLEQAARGIDFLNKPIHDLGKGPVPIVHGDIKPHNILVIGDAAVVCDFGLARAVETLRKTSMAPVTVAYAAPESFKGKVTPTSDQYSLAITYAELRTGRLPFDETMTPYQVMEAHVTRNLDFSRLPEPERLVVERATESNPEDRWPSSRDMVLALRQAAAKTGELPLRPGEAAYSGGPTPSHSLTARPRPHDTDLPTRIPVDPHKETMHPGGRTPSHILTKDTALSPRTPERAGSDVAETSLFGVDVQLPQPVKKSKAPLIVACIAAAAVVLGLAVGPKLLHDKSVAGGANSTTHSGQTGGGTNEGAPVDDEPVTGKNANYIKKVRAEIAAGRFTAAADLLDSAPPSLEDFEKENLQKRLRTAYLASVDAKIKGRGFNGAFSDLDDAPAAIGLTAEDKQPAREKIRVAWLAQAQQDLQDDPVRAIKSAQDLLKKFDGDRDSQFLIARAQLRQGNHAAALAMLNQLSKASDLPAEYQPLQAALLLLAHRAEAAKPEDWTKLLDDFLAYMALSKDTPATAAAALTGWERDQLGLVRSEVAENVKPLLETLPADQRMALYAKLEQLDSSAELQMFKVKSLLDEKKFDQARQLLKSIAEKVPPDATDMKDEVTATSLLIDLRDPATKPAEAVKTISETDALLQKVNPTVRGEICAAAEALALGTSTSPELLEQAIQLVSKARDLDPGDDAMTKRLARLLAARLALRAAQPAAPSKDDFKQWLLDCEQVEAAGLNNGVVDSLHAECLLGQDSRDRQLLTTLVERAKPVDGYTQFVQARVWRNLSQPDFAKIAELLTTAYADPAKSPPTLAAPYRRAIATRLLIEAAGKKRTTSANAKPAETFTDQFADAATADAVFRWLQLAQKLTDGIETSGLKLTDAESRDLQINLSLAAGVKTKPDDALAASLSASLMKLTDTQLGTNLFPVLIVAFGSHRADPASQPIAIEAAQRILGPFQKQLPVGDALAVKLYNEILQPALALADNLAKSKSPPANLDQFYAATAEFIGHYQQAKWPFADKQKEIESLLTKAITLNPKIAKYYTSRGVARISLTPPEVDKALSDAAEAAKLDANLPAAFALQGHALIYRSRQEPTRDARIADLDRAVENCNLSVEKSKEDDPQRGLHLLNLSMALLERANIDNDPKFKKDYLEKSIACAQQAVDLEKDKAYPDYAYTALANAEEDMAWIAGVEPVKNYRAAIEQFSAAIASNPAAPDPLIGRARCFYKAIADTKIDPKEIANSAEEAMQAAVQDLQQAQQLNPNLVEPNLWLGKADQQLKKFDEADEALGKAAKLAEDEKLPEQSLYLAEWARNAELNPSLSPAERTKTVRKRAEKLKSAPSMGGSATTKQAALLVGDCLLAEGKPAEALKEYDAALIEYDKSDPAKPIDPAKADGSDANLLFARAACRLSPSGEWNLSIAESVLKDLGRIKQLKPGPAFEAIADFYAANAKQRSLLSTSSTFTPDKKKEYQNEIVADVQNAIQAAPNDPASWEWRAYGARLLTARLTSAAAETVKSQGPIARQWIDDAIGMAGKRPDLAPKMAQLQRIQQDLDAVLTKNGLPRK
jgi:serine/threonine protein kinase